MLKSKMNSIHKPLELGKALYCKKCNTFLVKANKDGWIEFPKKLKISSNGEMFKIKCSCGEETFLKIK